MKYTIVACLVMSAASAFAEEATVPSSYNWSGAYLGVDAGSLRSQSRVELKGVSNPHIGDLGNSGALFAVRGGYLHHFSNDFVLGFDLDYSPSQFVAKSLLYEYGRAVPDNTFDSQINWSASASVRIGYAFDAFLPYISLGRSFARYDFIADYAATVPLPETKLLQGMAIALGLNYGINENWVAKFEYRMSDFGKMTFPIPTFPNTNTEVDLRAKELRVGLSYKF